MTNEIVLPDRILRWAFEELSFISNRVPNGLCLPSSAALEKICKGKNQKLWIYIINHVFSRNTASKIKSGLELFRSLRPECSPGVKESKMSQQISAVEVSSLLARKAFLQRLVLDTESEVILTSQKIEKMKMDIFEARNACALLNIFVHFLGEKKTLVVKFKDSVNALLNERKYGKTKQESDIRFLQHSSVLKISELTSSELSVFRPANFVNSKACTDMKKIISAIVNVFQESSPGIAATHDRELEIWGFVDNFMNGSVFFPQQVVMFLSQEAKKSDCLQNMVLAESFNVVKSQISKNQSIFSESEAKLQEMRGCHIKKFITTRLLLNKIKALETESSSLIHSFLNSVNEKNNEKGLPSDVFKSECSNFVASAQNKVLKQMLCDIQNKIKKDGADGIIRTSDVYALYSQIQNEMSELSKCNTVSINSLKSKQYDIWRSTKFGIEYEKSILNSRCGELDYYLNAEDNTLGNVSMKMHFRYPYDINAKFSLAGENVMSVFNVPSFQDASYVLISNCLISQQHINLIKEQIQARMKVLYKMKLCQADLLLCGTYISEKQVVRRQESLRQIESITVEADNRVRFAENRILKAQADLLYWWEQPAQFIPAIQVENKSLKEWTKLLVV